MSGCLVQGEGHAMLAHFSTNQPSCNYNVHSPLFFWKIIGVEHLPVILLSNVPGRGAQKDGGPGGFLTPPKLSPAPLADLVRLKSSWLADRGDVKE